MPAKDLSEKYLESYNQKKGEPATMCEVLDKIENRGIEKGIKKGIAQGITAFVKLCQEFGCSTEETADRLTKEFHLTKKAAYTNVARYWSK